MRMLYKLKLSRQETPNSARVRSVSRKSRDLDELGDGGDEGGDRGDE